LLQCKGKLQAKLPFKVNKVLLKGSLNKIAILSFIKKASDYYNIPEELLKAIAYVESGLCVNDDFRPWSINIQGKSYHFTTKLSALEFLKENLKLTKNIDIGLMQINYYYHGKNFNSLEDMFDLEKNINYAAKFLYLLYLKYGSWQSAIKRYHGNSEIKNEGYLEKVAKYLSYDINELENYFSGFKKDLKCL
jgi:soluble lytic murein transglycosylase-like protein